MINLTGTEGIRNTYREIREQLSRYLKTSSFGQLKRPNFPHTVLGLDIPAG
jgi:hypothetical protein